MLLLAGLLGCTSEPCKERTGDEDCDGVPDATDRCLETSSGALTDRQGCSGEQAAGCSLELLFPEDGARDPERFGWAGDCEVYVLQASDYPDFPPGATRSVWRGSVQEVHLAPPAEGYWRVVGGMTGRGADFATAPRSVR